MRVKSINIFRSTLRNVFRGLPWLSEIFSNLFKHSTVINLFIGIMCRGLAHGKMYKRATFEASCPSTPKSVGVCKSCSKKFITDKRNEMKKEEKDVRKHFVKTRMNDDELNQLIKFQQKTTEKDVSSYLRKIALQKPVTLKYRNQSADDFLKEMLPLKKELNAIGNNFNQAVHKPSHSG